MNKQGGFLHIFLIGVSLLAIGVLGYFLLSTYSQQASDQTTKSNQNQSPTTNNTSNIASSDKITTPDSPDTLNSPEKVASFDSRSYFVYGAPAGQNNKTIKKIIISLPGHSTTADTGYEAWGDHLTSTGYALAEFNWWDGKADSVENYYSPSQVVFEMQNFLKNNGYDNSDIVVLHGFSRGSANTYGVVVNDKLTSQPVIDAVISNSGQYESNYPIFDNKPNPRAEDFTTYYKDMPWILVCGGLDNSSNTSCEAMERTKAFLESHQVSILALLTDPNQGHGVFHLSNLDLPEKALNLIDKELLN